VAAAAAAVAVVVCAVACVAVAYDRPKLTGDGLLLFEPFDAPGLTERWTLSVDPKYARESALELHEATYSGGHGDKALLLKEAARYYGLSASIEGWTPAADKPLVVQYEVRLGKEHECGGVYLKLLSANASHADPLALTDKTPFTIMFGPDHCGGDTNKVHFIVRYPSPLTGYFEEKHLKEPPAMKLDVGVTHLYTLTLMPDGTFDIAIDGKSERHGNLLDDFDPPINPPKEIPDPEDKKPADWVDEEEIPDPDAKKPADWDEDAPEMIPDPDATKPDDWDENAPEMVPDPAAVKPADWDDDMDGEWTPADIPNPECEKHGCGKWERPMIQNPAYRGKWYPPMIKNPAYKGPFVPRRIPNPHYFYDATPFKALAPIARVAIEVWSVTPLVAFDNILVATNPDLAKQLASMGWEPKFKLEDAEHKKQEAAAAKAMEKDGATDEDDGWNIGAKLLKTVMKYGEYSANFVLENRTMGIAIMTAIIGFIPLMCWLCCRSPPSKKKGEEKKPATTTTAAAPEKPAEKPERPITPKKKAPRDDQ